jgi:prevent-host-death family protein
MSESISAADANRKFSQVLRGVREEGTTYVVTAHGKPVAKIVPMGTRERDERVSSRAKAELLKRLRSQPIVKVEHWTRDELYDD